MKVEGGARSSGGGTCRPHFGDCEIPQLRSSSCADHFSTFCEPSIFAEITAVVETAFGPTLRHTTDEHRMVSLKERDRRSVETDQQRYLRAHPDR